MYYTKWLLKHPEIPMNKRLKAVLLATAGFSQLATAGDLYDSNFAAMRAAKVCDRIKVTYPATSKNAEWWRNMNGGVVVSKKALDPKDMHTMVDAVGFTNNIPSTDPKYGNGSVTGAASMEIEARKLADEGGTITFAPIQGCKLDKSGFPVLSKEK